MNAAQHRYIKSRYVTFYRLNRKHFGVKTKH